MAEGKNEMIFVFWVFRSGKVIGKIFHIESEERNSRRAALRLRQLFPFSCFSTKLPSFCLRLFLRQDFRLAPDFRRALVQLKETGIKLVFYEFCFPNELFGGFVSKLLDEMTIPLFKIAVKIPKSASRFFSCSFVALSARKTGKRQFFKFEKRNKSDRSSLLEDLSAERCKLFCSDEDCYGFR